MAALSFAAGVLVVLKIVVPAGTSPTTLAVDVQFREGVAVAPSDARPIAVRATVRTGALNQVTVRLLRGVWSVDLRAEGYWAPVRRVRVEDDQPRELVVPLYHTAPLELMVEGIPADYRGLRAEFRGVVLEANDAVPAGAVECVVAHGRARCLCPIGTLDLRYEADGFIPVYDFARVHSGVPSAARLHLRFVRGSSISGYVTMPDGRPAAGRTVQVASVSPERVGNQAGRRDAIQSAVEPRVAAARTDGRGFFQVLHPPLGDVQVGVRELSGMGVASAIVKNGHETRLRGVLQLEAPMELPVSVFPTRAPDGTSWSVCVRRAAFQRPVLYRRELESDGQAMFLVTKGAYELELWNAGDRWLVRKVVIDAAPVQVSIRLLMIHVEGTLTLGAEPVSGRLLFGEISGSARVEMRSDETGRFEGTLPCDGDWSVSVDAPEVSVHRTFSRIPVAADASGAAQVRIELPNTVLRGRVLDERGLPVPGIVGVLPLGGADRYRQMPVDPPESAFEARGLPEGELRVEAEAAGGRRSAPQLLRLSEGKERTVTLVVKAERILRGRVNSVGGAPLGGASILAFEQGVQSASPRYVTDAAGHFELRLAQGTTQVTLVYWAEGHVTRMSAVPVSDGNVELILDPVGGTLSLDLDQDADDSHNAEPLRGMVGAEGAVVTLALLAKVVAQRGQLSATPNGARRTVTLQQLSRGIYTLCAPSPLGGSSAAEATASPRCANVVVEPGGQSRVSLPMVQPPSR